MMDKRSPEPGVGRSGAWAAVAGLALGLAGLLAFWSARRASEDAPSCGGYEECLDLGRRLRDGGRYGPAEKAYLDAIQKGADNSRVEYELGVLEKVRGRWQEAARHFNAALRLKPDDFAAYNELASSYLAMGRYQQAARVLLRAGRTGKKAQEAYVRLGYASIASGDRRAAKAAFKTAVALDTSSPTGYHHMAAYLFKMGRKDEAERYWKKAWERYQDPTMKWGMMCLHLAPLMIENRHFAQAEQLLRLCLAQAREDNGADDLYSGCWLRLGDLELARGNASRAEAFYDRARAACGPKARRSHASSPVGCLFDVFFSMAALRAHEGRSSEALALAARAEEESGKCVRRETRSGLGFPTECGLDLLAGFYARLGSLEREERVKREIVGVYRRMPRSAHLAEAEMNLANFLRKEGRMKEAAHFYKEAASTFQAAKQSDKAAAAEEALRSAREGNDGAMHAGHRRISKKLLHRMQAQGYW